jgi:hypothetical protein
MLIEEAKWFSRKMAALDPAALSPMLNVGSSSEQFRMVDQPYIDKYIFKPARERNVQVLHMDIEAAPGVDIVGDLAEPDFLRSLSEMQVRSVFCSNLLEHVRNREQIGEALSGVVPLGSYLFVSCPNKYPYHPDPIDTMFRPNVAELAALFPGTYIVNGSIVQGRTALGYLLNRPLVLAKTVARLFIPFYKPRNWWIAVQHSPWLFRRCKQTCLVLRKVGET